jgi:hypothetical protein
MFSYITILTPAKYQYKGKVSLKTRGCLFIFKTSETLEKNAQVTKHGNGKTQQESTKGDKINDRM